MTCGTLADAVKMLKIPLLVDWWPSDPCKKFPAASAQIANIAKLGIEHSLCSLHDQGMHCPMLSQPHVWQEHASGGDWLLYRHADSSPAGAANN